MGLKDSSSGVNSFPIPNDAFDLSKQEGPVSKPKQEGPIKKRTKSELSTRVHMHSDVDSEDNAQHHTLGFGAKQAAPGQKTKIFMDLYLNRYAGAKTNDTIVDTSTYVPYADWLTGTFGTEISDLRISGIVGRGTWFSISLNVDLGQLAVGTDTLAVGLVVIEDGVATPKPDQLLWSPKTSLARDRKYSSWGCRLEKGNEYEFRFYMHKATNDTAESYRCSPIHSTVNYVEQ